MRGGPGPSSLPPHSPDIAQSCRQLVGSSLEPSHVHDCSSRDDCLLTCPLASAFLTPIAPDLSPTLLATFDLSLRLCLCYPSFSTTPTPARLPACPPARLPRRAACSSPIEPPTFIYLYPSRLLTTAQQPLGSPHPHSTRAITCACACASLSPASNERQRRTAAAL
jgi:hypothetical protein